MKYPTIKTMKKLYFLIVVLLGSSMLQAQVPEQEFQALKAFYNATGGNTWKTRTGWENINTTATAADVNDSWYGITVTDGHVTRLGMNSNLKGGYLPPQIGDLLWLKYLEVDNGQLEGRVPEEIGNLVNLEGMTFSKNKFSGPLPASMANLVNMKYLYFSNNPLNSPFPGSILQSWPKLSIVYLSESGLSGTLPDVFDAWPDLYMFYVTKNNLTGEIPASLSKRSKLYEANFSQNGFSGTLPTLDSCKELKNIGFENNRLEGSVPESWGNLPQLTSVYLDENRCSGTLPAGLFAAKLERMGLGKNYFTFEGLEPHIGKINDLTSKSYTTNKLFPLTQKSVQVNAGDPLSLNAVALSVYAPGGNNNRYKWFRNNSEVYSGNDPSWGVSAATAQEAGVYRFEVTNTVVTDMTLKSEDLPVTVLVPGNHTPSEISFYPASIQENQRYDITLVIEDEDAGDVHHVFLTEGDGTNDQHNGIFKPFGNVLNMTVAADYETTPELRFLVTVSDMKGGVFTKALVVEVEDIAEAPVFKGQQLSTTIDETAPNGFTVMYLTAEDPGKLPVTYSLEGGNENGAFGIVGSRLVVADHTQLNYDQKNRYSLTVKASNGTLSSTAELVVSLSKINKMPVVENAGFTLAENSPAGTIAGSITASDPEGKALTYTLISGNRGEGFRLEGNKVVVNNAVALDFDDHPIFELVVSVSDGISNIPAYVTVQLTNLVDETGNDILTFAVPGMVSPPVIDGTTRTVKVRVEGVDPGSLKADFTLSKGASSQPSSGGVLNLASPLVIKVTSETGSPADWTITLAIPSPADVRNGVRLRVYPNPAFEDFHVTGLTPETVLRLTDISGRTLMTVSDQQPEVTLSLRGCRPGILFLIAEAPEGRMVYKIVKK